jgi:hypothetical protein
MSYQHDFKLDIIDFVNPNFKYNMFRGKDVDKIAKHICSIFDEAFEEKSIMQKFMYLIVELIFRYSKEPISLNSIIEHLNPLFLTKTYDSEVHYELFSLLAITRFKSDISNLRKALISFESFFGKFLDNSSSSASIVETLNSKNSICYFSIPVQMPLERRK